MKCKHCKEARGKLERPRCPICDKPLTDQCLACHQEIHHGVIRNQNIHIVGRGGGQNGLDRDPDAFGRADD